MDIWKDRIQPDKEPVFIELYDHKTDPLETKNIAENNSELVEKLMIEFNKGWKGNQPKKLN